MKKRHSLDAQINRCAQNLIVFSHDEHLHKFWTNAFRETMERKLKDEKAELKARREKILTQNLKIVQVD